MRSFFIPLVNGGLVASRRAFALQDESMGFELSGKGEITRLGEGLILRAPDQEGGVL